MGMIINTRRKYNNVLGLVPDPEEMLWEKKLLFIAVVKSSDSGAHILAPGYGL